MSLINQMLQDLESRRSEVETDGLFGRQIRAVQEQSGIHPAWWTALVLVIVLIGTLLWAFLRSDSAATQMSQFGNTQLPLKLDVGLNVASPMARVSEVPTNSSEAIKSGSVSITADRQTIPAPLAENKEPAAVYAGETLSVLPKATKSTDAAIKRIESGGFPKERGVLSVPELTNIIPAAKVLAPANPVRPAALAGSTSVESNKQIKELTPIQRAENEYRKAMQLLQQGKPADASNGLELALQLDPLHLGARQALIGLRLDTSRLDEALRLARDGLELDIAQPGLAMILARLQLEKNELRAAVETLERTLPYAADRPDYQAFIAALLQRDERHKAAVEHYLLALQKAPQNGVWWMGLGISLQADRRIAEAKEAFKRAKATNTLSPELLEFVDGRLSQTLR